ncbi:MAG: DegT/DnrJ/EryC1/StrS family aminotransferase, partial [Geminicoccaceae bacterium]
ALRQVAEDHGLLLIADAAQSFGGAIGERRVGAFGDYTTTSFFPAKPLGCYGDGGAVFTDDPEKADLLRSLRAHGKGSDRYDNVRIGLNSRLDTLQAAILLEKLTIFEDELDRRDRVAERYTAALHNVVQVPRLKPGCRSAWAQYTLRHPERDQLKATLSAEGVPSAVYYPIPLNLQIGYQEFPVAPGGVPVAERLSREVLSLPMHPYLEPTLQDQIIDLVSSTCRKRLKVAAVG